MQKRKLLSKATRGKNFRKTKGKADGGALFIVTTCMSIIALGLAFVGGDIPSKFPKANPNVSDIEKSAALPPQDTLQLVMIKPKPAPLIPTIDPNAPPLSTNKPPPGGIGGGGGTGVGPGVGLAGCSPPGPNDPEPPANYARTTYGGKAVNQRTKAMLLVAEKYAKMLGAPTPFSITQGSYNTGVAASAGTHDGGGVVDIGSRDTKIVQALRMAGFAAWVRTPAEGFAYHIHAVAIGDTELASIARQQVESYFQGRNGLSGNGPDTAPASIGKPVPAWAGLYGSCGGATGGTAPAPGGAAPATP